MLDWHRSLPRRRHHRHDPDAARRGRPLRRRRTSTENYRIRGFEEKPQHGAPSPRPFRPGDGQRLDGHLHFRDENAHRRPCARTPRTRTPRTISAGTCIPLLLDSATWSPTTSATSTPRGCATGGTSARSTPITRPTWTWSASRPSSTSTTKRWPIRTRMPQAPPAKFVFAQEGRRMGVATDSIVSRRVSSSPAGGSTAACSRPGCGSTVTCEIESSILLRRRQGRPLQPHPPRHHRPAREGAGGHGDRLRSG